VTDMTHIQELKFVATPQKGEVSALFASPPQPRAMLVLGHGAGSSLAHPLMQALSAALNHVGVQTFRFNYPYSETGRGMDAEAVRLATVRAAVLAAHARAGGLPVFAGGHSMSGRMMSLAHSRAPIPDLRGIVFFAFPLHPGAPDAARAAHLAQVSLPLLFVSGTRDKLADAGLLDSVVEKLAAARPGPATLDSASVPSARLHWVETADHGFKTLKGRKSEEPVMQELARVTGEWISQIAQSG
jgi:predicted alpha/beta-hydrolase family hydrolase